MFHYILKQINIDRLDRKWYEIIIWWEFRRLLYNIIMLGVGLASFCISFVSIPVIYLLVGFALNILYTLLWLIELSIRPMFSDTQKMNYPKKAFVTYLLLSVLFVFGLAFQLSFCWGAISFLISLA